MNNSEHWSTWIDTHGAKLVLFARRWGASHADAEDLVQEAFARFWKSRAGVADPLAYLYQCVRRVAIDSSRSQNSRRLRETHEQRLESPFILGPAESVDRQDELAVALAELPAEQAEVVVLKIWSDLTFAQISAVTSTPPGTVASRYRYALVHLREILSESRTT